LTHILDFESMLKNEDFVDAIQASNMKAAVKQRQALDDIVEYASESKPPLYNQENIRDTLLSLWGLN
jgi:hypothetical protein